MPKDHHPRSDRNRRAAHSGSLLRSSRSASSTGSCGITIGALDAALRTADERRSRLRERPIGSPLIEKDRQFFQRCAACSGQNDVSSGIVQVEAAEGNGDEVATQAGKIADRKDDKDVVAVLAKYEIGDSSDRLTFVVGHGCEFECIGSISSFFVS